MTHVIVRRQPSTQNQEAADVRRHRPDTASASSTRPRSSCDVRASPPPGCVTSSPTPAPPAARSSTTSRAARTSSSAEALEWSGSWAAERVVRAPRRHAPSVPRRLFTAMVDDWAADLAPATSSAAARSPAPSSTAPTPTRPSDRRPRLGPGDLAPADHRRGRHDGPDPTARRDALDPHALRARRSPRARPGAARHRSPAPRRPRARPAPRRLTPSRPDALRGSMYPRGHG